MSEYTFGGVPVTPPSRVEMLARYGEASFLEQGGLSPENRDKLFVAAMGIAKQYEDLLRELRTARPLLLYGDQWLEKIEDVLRENPEDLPEIK